MVHQLDAWHVLNLNHRSKIDVIVFENFFVNVFPYGFVHLRVLHEFMSIKISTFNAAIYID